MRFVSQMRHDSGIAKYHRLLCDMSIPWHCDGKKGSVLGGGGRGEFCCCVFFFFLSEHARAVASYVSPEGMILQSICKMFSIKTHNGGIDMNCD